MCPRADCCVTLCQGENMGEEALLHLFWPCQRDGNIVAKQEHFLTPSLSGFLPSPQIGGGRRIARRVATLPPCDCVKLFRNR